MVKLSQLEEQKASFTSIQEKLQSELSTKQQCVTSLQHDLQVCQRLTSDNKANSSMKRLLHITMEGGADVQLQPDKFNDNSDIGLENSKSEL